MKRGLTTADLKVLDGAGDKVAGSGGDVVFIFEVHNKFLYPSFKKRIKRR